MKEELIEKLEKLKLTYYNDFATKEIGVIDDAIQALSQSEGESKYYFITYQATNRQGTKSIWNDVIDKSPMEFIKHLYTSDEKNGTKTYYNFVVLNTCEISESQYKQFKGHF